MVQAVIATTVTGLQGRQVAATPAPTNNQALVWNGTAWVPSGPYLTAAGAPYIAENYCDNSGLSINQRSYASGSALAAGAYGLDRWKAGASGCTLTFTASPASTQVTIAAGTLQQVVEGVNFINSTYVLSWLGSATGRVNTGAYVASPIIFTGAPNTNVTIEFQGGTLAQVQLQIGNQATLWQPQSFSTAMLRCQRFFCTGVLQIAGYNLSGNGIYGTWYFPAFMRTVPTLTYNISATQNSTLNFFTPNSNQSAYMNLAVTTTGTALLVISATASADL